MLKYLSICIYQLWFPLIATLYLLIFLCLSSLGGGFSFIRPDLSFLNWLSSVVVKQYQVSWVSIDHVFISSSTISSVYVNLYFLSSIPFNKFLLVKVDLGHPSEVFVQNVRPISSFVVVIFLSCWLCLYFLLLLLSLFHILLIYWDLGLNLVL